VKLKTSLKTVNEYCAWLKEKLDAPKFNQLLRIAVLWRVGRCRKYSGLKAAPEPF